MAHPESWQGMQVLARGAWRICVLDPGSPDHCLKYSLPAASRKSRRRVPQRNGDDNQTEWCAYLLLRERLGPELDARVAVCEGIVDTAAGTALRCRLARDGDGSRAPALLELLEAGTDDALPVAALCAAVDRLEDWLLRHRVPLTDLNPGNFAVVRAADAVELVCLDLKSTLRHKELVPLARWSWWWMRRKIRRRAQRLRERIRAAADPHLRAPLHRSSLPVPPDSAPFRNSP